MIARCDKRCALLQWFQGGQVFGAFDVTNDEAGWSAIPLSRVSHPGAGSLRKDPSTFGGAQNVVD
jgi:hypothetical protein